MTDTTPESVERNICNPIISHVHDGRGLSEKRCGEIIDTARALVAENERLRAELKLLRDLNHQAEIMRAETFAITFPNGLPYQLSYNLIAPGQENTDE